MVSEIKILTKKLKYALKLINKLLTKYRFQCDCEVIFCNVFDNYCSNNMSVADNHFLGQS